MLHFEAHGLGDPVHGFHVEAGGLAVFTHVGEGRVVGIDAVDVGLGLGGHSHAEHGEGGEHKRKTFHGFLTVGV